jgi:hypothetical protein
METIHFWDAQARRLHIRWRNSCQYKHFWDTLPWQWQAIINHTDLTGLFKSPFVCLFVSLPFSAFYYFVLSFHALLKHESQ